MCKYVRYVRTWWAIEVCRGNPPLYCSPGWRVVHIPGNVRHVDQTPIPIGETMRIQARARRWCLLASSQIGSCRAHKNTHILTRNRTRIKASITLLMALCGTGFSSIGSTFDFHPPLYIASRSPPRISLHRSPALYQQSQVLYSIRIPRLPTTTTYISSRIRHTFTDFGGNLVSSTVLAEQLNGRIERYIEIFINFISKRERERFSDCLFKRSIRGDI